jgi:hypothetical protein
MFHLKRVSSLRECVRVAWFDAWVADFRALIGLQTGDQTGRRLSRALAYLHS